MQPASKQLKIQGRVYYEPTTGAIQIASWLNTFSFSNIKKFRLFGTEATRIVRWLNSSRFLKVLTLTWFGIVCCRGHNDSPLLEHTPLVSCTWVLGSRVNAVIEGELRYNVAVMVGYVEKKKKKHSVPRYKGQTKTHIFNPIYILKVKII